MANTLKIKRGTAATIPQGQLAEPLFTTDTYDLYIGKGSGGNQRIQNYIASGTSSQFLKGDGTLDSTSYQPLITAGTTLQYYRGDKTFQTLDTSVVPENGPIYFTEPRVRATVLTGLNLSGGGTIAATDSILTAFGKVQNQISALVGGATYQGTWNASTNTPTLASGTGTKGYYYVVSVAGSTNLDGITDWKIGDWAIFNGTTWDKVDNTDAVSSVNGFTGAVNLALDNISDVSAASPTNAQLLRFNGTSSLWENWTPTFEPALTKGNLTEATSSVLTITGGTGAVIGSGTTIAVSQASGSTSGYLSSTDWTTFNSKQAQLNGTGFVKATGTTISYDNSTYLTTSSAASTYLPLAGGTLTGALSGTSSSMSSTSTATAFIPTGSTVPTNGMYLSAANTLSLSTNSTRAITISDGQKVGIGADPISAYRLYVNGDIYASNTVYGSIASFTSGGTFGGSISATTALFNQTSNQLILQNVNGGTNAEKIAFFMNSNDTFKILSLNDNNTTRVDNILVANVLNGNVGIGTTSPADNLHIAASEVGNVGISVQNTNASYSAQIRFLNSAGTEKAAVTYVQSNDSLVIANNSQNVINITSGGNVGIGTSSPDTYSYGGTRKFLTFRATLTNEEPFLQLIANGSGNSIIDFGNATIRRATIIGLDGSHLAFYTNGSNSGTSMTERMRITSGGGLKIFNSSPSWSGDGMELSYNGTNSLIGSYDRSTSTYKQLYFYGSNTIFENGGSERMRITSGGNVGINETSANFKLHISAGSTSSITQPTAGSYAAYIQQNTSGSTGGLYIQDGASNSGNALYIGDNNGAARFVVNGDGQVGIGTASPTNPLHIQSNTVSQLNVTALSGNTNAQINLEPTGTGIALIGPANNVDFAFRTNASERMRITSGGYLKASNDGTYIGSTGTYHEFTGTTAASDTLSLRHKAASQPFGQSITFSAATPNNVDQYFLYCQDSTNVKAIIWSNGTFNSRTNTYTSVSDINLKQDIIDASSQWNDIKNLTVRKYRLKDEVAADENYPYHIGVVAQELELISPNLVEDIPNYKFIDGEKVVDGHIKTVKYSVLYMKAIKALQEAMIRIEKLEAKLS